MLNNTPPGGPALPSWCAPPDPLIGRDDLVVRVRAALGDGPVTLVGAAGVGATAVASAVISQLVAEGAVGRVAAWRGFSGATLGDAALVLGLRLNAALPGDLASLERSLAQEPPTAILLDDADLSPGPVRELQALGGRVVWVATGREPVIGAAIEVPALQGVTPPISLDELPPELEVYAALPMGLPADPDSVPSACRLALRQRVVIRRAVREALGAHPIASPTALAAALRDRLDALHRLALDLDIGHAAEDLPLLRAAARRVADPELRALAAAGAARLSLRAYQASEALNIARNGLLRPLPAGARGLLRWLEGDALWAQGADVEARHAWHTAGSDLRDGALEVVCAALARSCADREAARGRFGEARMWLQLSREALGVAREPIALADCMRIEGDLAAASGELVSAEGLYDEAETMFARSAPEDAALVGVWLGRAALALARGQLDTASTLLERAAARARDPRDEAATAFRRAELALRRGDRSGASTWEARARAEWRVVGGLHGLTLCARLRGDIAALDGDRPGALVAWDEALALCGRQRDLGGLRRVLARVVAVESEGVPGPHLDAWREIAALADVVAERGA